jgi:hypothetical protein
VAISSDRYGLRGGRTSRLKPKPGLNGPSVARKKWGQFRLSPIFRPDYGFFAWDIFEQVRFYNEFKQKLKNAQQRECKCEQEAMDK